MRTELDLGMPPRRRQEGVVELGQYFTPEWAALALVEKFFPDLSTSDTVVEPGCGRGAFLKAIPEHIHVIGVEIDSQLAEQARLETGRTVLCGDFRTIDLPKDVTAFIGNPPFKSQIIEEYLMRCRDILPNDGRCGFILPAHLFNYHSTVNRLRQNFSIEANHLPRTLYSGLQEGLMFVLFRKNKLRLMHGMALYDEQEDVCGLNQWAKVLLVNGAPNRTSWRALVEEALTRLGGRAKLSDIYAVIEPARPATNNFWKEKVRQILQRHFTPIAQGTWAI